MKFAVSKSIPTSADALAVAVVKAKSGAKVATRLSSAAKRLVQAELKRRKSTGSVGELFLLPAPGETGTQWLLVAGVGPGGSDDDIRRVNGSVVVAARAHHLRHVALESPTAPDKAEQITAAIVEGSLLGDYRFDRHKSGQKPQPLTITAVHPRMTAALSAAIRRGEKRGRLTAEAQILARDLANEPPSRLTPDALAKEARVVARKAGLGVSVMGPAEIKRAGMGAYIAVSKGSDEPPRFIRLTYRPKGAKRHIALVGKSITYDAGGLNIKPTKGGSLEEMKLDMSGGAAVLGAMSALKRLGIRVAVTGYLPATENLLGGSAYKPGDILKTFSGKTIEVGNTDAEGRLVLADALAYAVKKDKPDQIIDLATLTATDFSLGPAYAAIFASDSKLEARFKEAGEKTGEKVWPLPFPEEYNEMTKSPVADFSNIVSGRAYTLSGPLLLRHFVGKTPWVHLDIGGPASADKDAGYTKKGGSGWGTRLLLEYLRNA